MSDEADRAALERVIDEAPDSPAGYAVLGDWLSQRGDPRGELIALQQLPSLDRKQRERVKALVMLKGIRCLSGPLAQWRWGFVHTATLLRPTTGFGEAPWIERLLEHASARFLRELTLGQEPLHEALTAVERQAPRVLTSLSLYSPRPIDLSFVPVKLPVLSKLSFSAPELAGTLGKVATLRTLELAYVTWSAELVSALFEQNGSQLTEVKLVFAEAPASAALEALTRLPMLSSLTIEASTMGIEAVERLAELKTVTRLDLSRSGLTERAAKRLLQLSRTMPALSTLNVGDAP